MHVLSKNLLKFSEFYPEELVHALKVVAEKENKQLYVVGGTVRDLLLARRSNDLDISVSRGSHDTVRHLIRQMGGGAFVDLSGPEDEAARMVWQGIQVDIASFRKRVEKIEDDLQLRDFTINGMGVKFEQLAEADSRAELIDPAGGFADLMSGRLRHCQAAFVDDPVRMLRGYRVQATLNFSFEKETEKELADHAFLINTVAVERSSYELGLIFDSPRTGSTLRAMCSTGLLQELFPELFAGIGVLQPGFHHLDVFEHNMLALEMIEKIIADPGKYFPGLEDRIGCYLEGEGIARGLKWAALCHDLGKPATRAESEKKQGQITFYGHDEVGSHIFCHFAERMRWSRKDKENVASLVGMHMHPFHLCNIARDGELTKRAALKLCKRAGERLPGLFLLAMSDCLAGQGEKKPEYMEYELVALLRNVLNIYEDHIKPVTSGPRLLTGRDLIDEFGLDPSPLFSEIFEKVEIARVEGEVTDRPQAMAWLSDFLKSKKPDNKMNNVGAVRTNSSCQRKINGLKRA